MDQEIGGWKYREVTTKSGKTIVFGRLDELLMGYYGVPTVGSLDPYRSNYQDQYIIRCPFCSSEGHTKSKLHILPNTSGVDDFETGYCFVCGRSFIHISDRIEVTYRVPKFLPVSPGKFNILPMTDSTWTLDKFEKEFKGWSKVGVDYLISRNPFLGDLWKPLGFKFFEDHVAMPFYDPDGNLIYYQIRFTNATSSDSIRYFFPRTTSKPPYILHPPTADPSLMIIVEGVFDAIAAMIQSAGKYVVIGCMGSKLSDYQLAFLREFYNPRKILVWMDETVLSRGITKRLQSVFNYSEYRIIKSSGPDPEEILIHKLRHGFPVVWIKEDYGEKKEKGPGYTKPRFLK